MNNKRYVAIMAKFVDAGLMIIGIIDRKLINLELDKKINSIYRTMWLDMCPININRTISIENKELELESRTF